MTLPFVGVLLMIAGLMCMVAEYLYYRRDGGSRWGGIALLLFGFFGNVNLAWLGFLLILLGIITIMGIKI